MTNSLRRSCVRMGMLGLNHTLLIICLNMPVLAQANAQTSIDLHKGLTLKEAFESISRQSGYDIFCEADMLAENKRFVLSRDLKKATLDESLTMLARIANLHYWKIGKTIYLAENKPEISPDKPDPAPSPLPVQMVVSGTVYDENSQSLPGVSVVIKGSDQGVQTNLEGSYSIEAAGNDTLVFSLLGYQEQEVAVNERTQADITLLQSLESLDEVVVVGYGEQKKVTVTGSVSSVSSKDVKSIPTSNMVTGLAGKLPGLRVTQRTSEPGAYNTAFDIRGFGGALVVVDGIVRSDFNRIDPNEIESITVLKDASAAVYGIKAANGVILVTTKKGSLGEPVITYSGNYSITELLNTPRVGDAYQFAVLTTENEINQGKALGSTTYSPDDIQKFKDGTYPSTDWLMVGFNKHGNISHHNLNITGGSEKVKYFASLGYLDEMGLYKSGDLNYQKYNMRSSVSFNFSENLSAQLNVDAMSENRNESAYPAANVMHYTWMNKPTFPVYANNTPPYMQDFTYPFHPIAVTTADIGGYRKTKTQTFQGNLNVDYKFAAIEGLSAKFLYSYYNSPSYQKFWNKRYSVYTYDELTDTYLETGVQNSPSNLTGNYSPLERNTVLGQLDYQRFFLDKHNVKATVAYEQRHEATDNLWARKEFEIDVDQFFAGVSANAQVNSSDIYENANQNIITRFNYDYLSKYLFEFGFNYGGSSRFPKGKRWGFFPYASAGWNLSEEGFFRDRFPFVTNLKIRGSWGQMGDDGAAAFQFLTGYNYPVGNYVFNNEVLPGLGFRGMPNPNITWFTVTTKNIGLDLTLWEGLFSMQFDLFQRDRSGLLATRSLTIPGTVGAELPQENLNKDMRRGFELVLGHARNINKLRYDISANITYTRGRNTYVERSPDGNSYLNWRNNTTDRWANFVWGYQQIGQFQTQEEVYNSPIQDGQGNRTLRPGNIKYEDLNKDGLITELDMLPIARDNSPEINFGLNISLAWRNFDLNVFAQGASNFNIPWQYQLNPLNWGRNSMTLVFDRWHHEDIFDVNSPWVPGKYPPINWTATDTWESTFWREDATYVRLKNLELGYTLNQEGLKKVGIESVRVYASGFNLLTYSVSDLTFRDPEQEMGGYPLVRNYSMGLTVTF